MNLEAEDRHRRSEHESGNAIDERDPLDRLAEEFLELRRQGRRPSIAEFAARVPDRRDEVRDLLSALLLVEELKPATDATVDHGAGDTSRPDPDEPILDRLGDFRLIREIGRGGMGVVYEAEQLSLRRRVALKVLSARRAPDSHLSLRFEREARFAAQLHHSNIVPVFGVGHEDGHLFYAMQLIQGPGLDKVLLELGRLREVPARGSQPTIATGAHIEAPHDQPSGMSEVGASGLIPTTSTLFSDGELESGYAIRVAGVGLQVAEALEYAHQAGTLHRDIKPSNILLDPHRRAWVTDFGLAKAAEEDDLTRTGDVVGTLRYMAPERFRGQCDVRSDVFSLGLTLYEMLALRPAFDAADRQGLIYQVAHDEPPRLRTLCRGLPRDLETIVHKAIEKDPGDRYPTAAALADDLRSFLEDRSIAARRVGSTERLTRWARRNPGLATLGSALAAMLALVVAVVIVADFRLRREHAATTVNLQRAERAEADLLGQLLESDLAHARAARRGIVAGRRTAALAAIASAARNPGSQTRLPELRNEAIAALALTDLVPAIRWKSRPDEGYLGVDFDPDVQQIARGAADGSILILGPDSVELARLPGDGLRAEVIRFHSGGRFLAAKLQLDGRDALRAWDLLSEDRILDIPDGVHANAFDIDPVAPRLVAARRDGSIVVYDLTSRSEIKRFSPGILPHALSISPSGREAAIASVGAAESVQVRDLVNGSILAGWTGLGPVYAVRWHTSGEWLAVGCEDGRIWRLDPGDPSAPPRLLGVHDAACIALAFHPDGLLVASLSWDGSLRLWDLRTAREVVRATVPEGRSLRFSRDGRFLGPGHDGTSWCLWEVIPGLEQRALADEAGSGVRSLAVGFHPSGQALVAASPVGIRMARLDRDASPASALSPTAGLELSPDGSALLTTGEAGLLRWPIEATGTELIVGPPTSTGLLDGVPCERIRLAPDGRAIAVVVDRERGRVLIHNREDDPPAVEIGPHPGVERLDFSPDGRLLVTGTWRGSRVKVWDTRSGDLIHDLPVEGSADVRFSPDGDTLVTGSSTDYTLWDTVRWLPRLVLPRHQVGGLPGTVAFRPDNRVLAIAKTRTLIALVDPSDGVELASLEPSDSQHVVNLCFSPTGDRLAVGLSGGGVQIWNLSELQAKLAGLALDWSTGARETVPRWYAGIESIRVNPPPWLESLTRAEQLSGDGHWELALESLDEAIRVGARHLGVTTRRMLFLRVLGNESGYQAEARLLLDRFGASPLAPFAANNLAWSLALGPSAVEDYEPAIALARAAVESRPETHRLNTLGALLYRAGRYDEALDALNRAVAAHGAGGTQYDSIFLAMTHARLGHPVEAREWLDRATTHVTAPMRKPGMAGDTTWIPVTELDLLSREASAVVQDLTNRPTP